MALIPDEAVDRMYGELTSGARDLYIYLARCRNQKTGKCCPSVQTIMSSIGLSRGQVYAIRKELDFKGWAKFQANNAELLIGFNILKSLENQTTNNANKEVDSDRGESLENQTNSLENQTELSGKPDSHIRKNQQRNQQREQEAVPFENLGIGDALEGIFPGYATDFRKMQELYLLCDRIKATAQDVLNFPAWLKKSYPMKSISIFAFKDLLAESLTARPQVKKVNPDQCPTCSGWKVVLKSGMDKFNGTGPTMPCPDCSKPSSTENNEVSNVIETNRFAGVSAAGF